VKFNKPFLEVNRFQAMLPKNAQIVENDLGTASGMWFTKDGKIVVSMPGVPYEMKALMLKVVEKLKTTFTLGDFYHNTILIQGIGESYLADDLIDWENEMRGKDISVSYLPSIGQLKLRLTGKGNQKNVIDDGLKFIEEKYPKNVFGYNSQTLEEVLGALLIKENKTVATVESCTAGNLSSRIVSVPGSSQYYNGSIISYSNTLKIDFVGVNPNFIKEFGAVSQQTVEDMAKNGCRLMKSDYCIATSGIAGPDGGTAEKPVGTIWIGVATNDEVWSKMFNFGHTRGNNIESTVNYALNFLRRIILNIEN
jgi:nicotinamide-nucleotide amidase